MALYKGTTKIAGGVNSPLTNDVSDSTVTFTDNVSTDGYSFQNCVDEINTGNSCSKLITAIKRTLCYVGGKSTYLNMVYPVGSIYMSVNSTNPSNLFGGTWEQLKDRFLLGTGDSYTNGNTGGESGVYYQPTGQVENHTLTVAQMPSHTHNYKLFCGSAGTSQTDTKQGKFLASVYNADGSTGYLCGDGLSKENHLYYNGSGNAHNHGFTGYGTTLNNMPPYLVVYMWKRTA